MTMRLCPARAFALAFASSAVGVAQAAPEVDALQIEAPWKLSRIETVDAYMQIIPPGSRSGKHRHLAEECVYVLEGKGYDLHQDCDVEITDVFAWKINPEVKRFEWEAGDYIYIPPNTVHQHFNADPKNPVRLISSTARIFRQMGLNTLDQMEDAPEYDPKVVLTSEIVRQYLRGERK